MVSRDIFSPAQKFMVGDYKYVKDRGYAFEEKLNRNTRGILNLQLKNYSSAEKSASVPLMIFNSTITQDGRRMMISTQPISFMMKPQQMAQDTLAGPDAIDFAAMFARQNPMNLRLLTALRMNATFPYVLPSVWLPSIPVIDVMDAGLRDNFGQETTLRFIDNFKGWLAVNTSAILILQLRDRLLDNWQEPYETGSITDFIIKPGTMLQHNWQKLQDYSEADQYEYLNTDKGLNMKHVVFIYVPQEEDKGAALNFHLTASEKKDVTESFNNKYNRAALQQVLQILK